METDEKGGGLLKTVDEIVKAIIVAVGAIMMLSVGFQF